MPVLEHSVSPLETPLQYLKGVGPRRSALLAKLSLRTVRDLLGRFPRAYDDRSRLFPLAQTLPGPGRTLRGTVESFVSSRVGRQLALGRAEITDETGRADLVWFRRSSPRYDVFARLARQLVPGTRVMAHGMAERTVRGLELRVGDMEVLGPADSPVLHAGRVAPLYDLTEGLDARFFRELVDTALSLHASAWEDPLPEGLRAERGFPEVSRSLRDIHFPETMAGGEAARRRFAFEEFFFLELALARVRVRRDQGPPAHPCRPTRALLTPFRGALGFDFTPAQRRVIVEIFDDMARPAPMNRLLQGDVGSGKTAVAVSAMLLALESGRQAALMAPTEILAEQHAHALEKMLAGLPVQWALVTGSLSRGEKRDRLAALADGSCGVAVGTHALLEEAVRFRDLGLVVVDEQHRFGVRQRARLREKSQAPHTLVMTATPIPRTLALTLYGDLDVSTLDAMPPGRAPVVTRWTPESVAVTALREAVAQGRQGYVVYPLVEESEVLDLKAAVKEWERFKALFPGVAVGLLHGRLPPREKEAAMARFQKGETKILVATPVIEVGIDVPNAAVMVIAHAERFGLAQLHQLRGRVGRGVWPSACYLVSSARTPEAVERLTLLCSTRDGFRLAEADLRLRGPGEFLGEAQHGLPPFAAARLVTDGDILEDARREARALLAADPDLRDPAHAGVARRLQQGWEGKMLLGQVG
jgi:ATP-dependent DNA helicase RecG